MRQDIRIFEVRKPYTTNVEEYNGCLDFIESSLYERESELEWDFKNKDYMQQ